MMELFPTWLTPGTTDSLLLLVGEQPQTDLIAGALHSLSPCAGGASGGRLAVWCTGRYSLLAAAELQADTLDLAWDTFSANKLATVGAGPHLSFWTLLERPSCRSSELQASHVPVPQELLHTEVAVGGGCSESDCSVTRFVYTAGQQSLRVHCWSIWPRLKALCGVFLWCVCTDSTSVLHGARPLGPSPPPPPR